MVSYLEKHLFILRCDNDACDNRSCLALAELKPSLRAQDMESASVTDERGQVTGLGNRDTEELESRKMSNSPQPPRN